MAGAYTDQRLNLSKLWEGRRKKCQGFKPDPGNAAVRDYRGGVGKRQPWWECAPVLQSKERETETPHLQRGAPDFYPNQFAPTSPTSPKSRSPGGLEPFAPAQCRDLADGDRKSRRSDYHGPRSIVCGDQTGKGQARYRFRQCRRGQICAVWRDNGGSLRANLRHP